jgi:hypothetical protein
MSRVTFLVLLFTVTAVQISPVGGWRGDEEKAEAPGRLDWGSWKNQFSRRRLSL